MTGKSTVPQPVAEQICADLQQNRKWYNLVLWQCLGVRYLFPGRSAQNARGNRGL